LRILEIGSQLMDDFQDPITYLKQSRTLEGFPDELLQQLIPLSVRYRFDVGEVILQERSVNNQVFILMKGVVTIYSHGEFIIRLKRGAISSVS